MSSTPLALTIFGGSTLDSTATLDTNSTALQNALNSANTYSNPLADSSAVANTIIVQQAAGLAATYAFGLLLFIKVANTTTATAVSINVNGQGAKTVLLPGGGAPPIGSFAAGGVYGFVYDGVNFQAVGVSSINLLSSNNTWTGTNAFNNNVVINTPATGFSLVVNAVAGQAGISIDSAAGQFAGISLAQAGQTNAFLYNPVATNDLRLQTGGVDRFAIINATPALEGYGPVAAALVDMTPDAAHYVATVGGFLSAPTPVVYWARNGIQVTMFIPVISAASNATFFTVSIPAAITPPTKSQFQSVPVGLSDDNSAPISDCIINISTGGQIQFYHNSSANGWTAAGNKSSGGFSFSYLLI